MPVKAIYNTIASQYATADCFGSITESHHTAIQQIKQASFDYNPDIKVLDLGVGDGAFLRKIKPLFPTAELTGIDVSGEMLKRARADLFLNTIEASAAVGAAVVMQDSFRALAHERKWRNVVIIFCGGNVDLDHLPWSH